MQNNKKHRAKLASLAVAAMFTQPVTAEVKTIAPLNIKAAQSGVTRLIFDNKIIKHVLIYPESAATINIFAGIAFLTPSESADKLQLCLITEDGTTQDLMVSLIQQTPAAIKITENAKSK